MPGPAHETLITLLAEAPGLMNELLVTLGHPPPPPGLVRADATVRAANPLAVTPDLLFATKGEKGHWMVVEVQQAADADKARRWLALAAVLHDTRGATGDVVVLTHEASVERWAREVAQMRGPGGTALSLCPLVVRVTRVEAERLVTAARPELAVVAAWAVHDQKGRRAQALIDAAIDRVLAAGALRMSLLRAMLSMLRGSLRNILERRLAMLTDNTFPEPPELRRIRLTLERRALRRGIAKGVAEGMAKGVAEGKVQALLAVLSARGFVLDDDARARIVGCRDTALLDRWVVRAATSASLRDVLDAG